MNLLDLYVSEIGRRLPQKMRADIEAEIRSALQDLIDGRSREARKPIDEEMTLAVLEEYGDPGKVAASYVEERYLIGPRIYPTFLKVVFVVVPVIAILVLIPSILFLIGSGTPLFFTHSLTGNWIQLAVQTIWNPIWSVLLTVGIITLIFAILERIVPEFKPKDKVWDPHSLLKIKPPDRIRTGSLITNILFTSLAILVFNFSPGAISFGYESYGAWWVCIICSSPQTAWRSTILSATFFHYLPALDILWGLSIILALKLLHDGHWQTTTRWFNVGLNALSIGLAAWMLAGSSLIITASTLKAAGFPATAVQAAFWIESLNQIIRLVLGTTIVISGVTIIQQLIRMRPRPS